MYDIWCEFHPEVRTVWMLVSPPLRILGLYPRPQETSSKEALSTWVGGQKSLAVWLLAEFLVLAFWIAK